MPIFITQGCYTAEAMKGMVAMPEDREVHLRGVCERAGGRLLGYYMTFGEHDFLSIVEMPDHHADLAMLIAGASNGSVSNLKTMLAVTPQEFMKACERAKELAAHFKPAGRDA